MIYPESSKMESNDFFSFTPQYGCWETEFRYTLAYVGCSTTINASQMTPEQMKTDKPIYCGIMARRQQLQPILDNPHLFDHAFVNAVKLVIQMYDDIEVR